MFLRFVAPAKEIKEYLLRFAREYDLYRHIQFVYEVTPFGKQKSVGILEYKSLVTRPFDQILDAA